MENCKQLKRYTIIPGKIDHVNPHYAYLIPERKSKEPIKDVWIEKQHLNSALHLDLVEVKIIGYQKKSERFIGEVINILRRVKTRYIGYLYKKKKNYFVEAIDRKIYTKIYIPFNEVKHLKSQDKVTVEVTQFMTSRKKYLQGKIVQVMDKKENLDNARESLRNELGLPSIQFPKRIEKELIKLSDTIPEKILNTRKDCRELPTFTIDPITAKDFDDALSIQKLAPDQYELGVHIADVSFYVKSNSVLDKEAYKRGNSIYLVDGVIPMLPEKLSNDLCSLNTKEDKLAFSIFFKLNEMGEVLESKICESVIRVDKNFSYAEAQKVLDDQVGTFYGELKNLEKLTRKFRELRSQQGALHFDKLELEVVLDSKKNIVGIEPSQKYFTNILVEECMLLANKRIAEYVVKEGKRLHKKLPFIYRTHDDPEEGKLMDFKHFLKSLKYSLKIKKKNLQKSFTEIKQYFQGQPISSFIETLSIRTMAKAIYTTADKKHFGLAFRHYTHFTSPIRRYADLWVHRAVKYLLKKKYEAVEIEEKKCGYLVDRENLATEAERAMMKWCQLFLLKKEKKSVLKALITSIVDFGLYVELLSNQCEGLIRLQSFRGDYYKVHQHKIIGRRTRKEYCIGQVIKVQIETIDLDRRLVDFIPLE